MLHTALRKRAQVLAPIIVLSIVLTAVTAFAASQLITAKKGGTIDIAPGVELVFLPKALEEDTEIIANMYVGQQSIVYDFGPDGTVLSKPARLIVSREVIKDAEVDDLVLYGEDGEEIAPKKNKKRLIYKLNHFSRYYHRRR
ncbi:hypothetical protein ACFL6S_26235 [Candidatus Poribacteria bacterium]